jgi:hypothetical protein
VRTSTAAAVPPRGRLGASAELVVPVLVWGAAFWLIVTAVAWANGGASPDVRTRQRRKGCRSDAVKEMMPGKHTVEAARVMKAWAKMLGGDPAPAAQLARSVTLTAVLDRAPTDPNVLEARRRVLQTITLGS